MVSLFCFFAGIGALVGNLCILLCARFGFLLVRWSLSLRSLLFWLRGVSFCDSGSVGLRPTGRLIYDFFLVEL